MTVHRRDDASRGLLLLSSPTGEIAIAHAPTADPDALT